MLARPQSKITVALVALSIGVALVSIAAAVSRLVPTGLAGTVVWVVSLAALVPLAITAFNAICDRLLREVAPQRKTESLLESYWPTVQRDLANQFHLNGKRHANGAAHADGHSEGEPLAPPTIAADPLHRPTMQRSRHKWWVGQ